MNTEWTPALAKLMKFLLGLIAVLLTLAIIGSATGEDETSGISEPSGYCVQECEPIPAEHQNAAWADWYLDKGGDMSLYIDMWDSNWVSTWEAGEGVCNVLQDLFDANIGSWNHNLDRGQREIAQYFKANVDAISTRGDQLGCSNFEGMGKF